jgi:hypothetical protein
VNVKGRYANPSRELLERVRDMMNRTGPPPEAHMKLLFVGHWWSFVEDEGWKTESEILESSRAAKRTVAAAEYVRKQKERAHRPPKKKKNHR